MSIFGVGLQLFSYVVHFITARIARVLIGGHEPAFLVFLVRTIDEDQNRDAKHVHNFHKHRLT